VCPLFSYYVCPSVCVVCWLLSPLVGRLISHLLLNHELSLSVGAPVKHKVNKNATVYKSVHHLQEASSIPNATVSLKSLAVKFLTLLT
jgi:hypothetical protein